MSRITPQRLVSRITLLRLERAGDLSSELRAAFRSGDLSWVQAHALMPILELEHSQPWRAAWVAHAAEISVRRLEDDVERAIATGHLDPSSLSDPLSEEVQTGAHPTVSGETIHLFFTAPTDVARLFKALLATVQRRIERRNGRTASESEALDAMLEHCFAAWSPEDPKISSEHRVFERDGWRCTVPGCTSYRNLHSHHIWFRSDHGPDDDWNRTSLCAAHSSPLRARGDRTHPHPWPRARRAALRAAARHLRAGRADSAMSAQTMVDAG